MAGLFDDLIPGAKPGAAGGGMFGDLIPAKPKTRNPAAVANDWVIEAGNAVAGGVKSVADFVAPGNAVSSFIEDNIIKPGEASQSDAVRVAKAKYAADMEAAGGIGDEIGATLGYAAGSPGIALSQAVGSFVLPGAAVKGGGMLASLGRTGAAAERAAVGGGLAGGAVAGAALSGGDAAGTAYELVMRAGGTEEQATEAARKASVLPAAIGAAGGVIGAERLFAGAGGFKGGMLSRALKTAGVEGVQEGIEEGVTQYEGQAAAVPFDPSIDPMKGVAGAATMGAVLGGATGAGVSLLAGKKPEVADVLGAPSVDEAIKKAEQVLALPAPASGVADGVLALPGPARTTEPPMLRALPAPGGVVYMADEAGNVAPQPAAARAEAVTRAAAADIAATQQRLAEQQEQTDLGMTPGLRKAQATREEGNLQREPIPAGEATEVLPTGEVEEFDAIPAGEATEFETLPVGEILDGDLMARDGEPFGSKTGAQAKAYASGGGRVVPIPDHFGSGIPGYVVRPLMPGRPSNTRGTDARDLPRSSNVNQPDVAGTAGQPVADGAGRPDAAVGGQLAAGRVAADATGQQPGTAAAVAPGSAGNAPVGVADAADAALTDPKADAPYYVKQPRTGTRIPVPSPEAAAAALGEFTRRTGAEPADGSIDVFDAATGLPAFNVKPDGTVKKVETREEAEARSRRMIEDEKRTVDAGPGLAPGARVTLNGTPYTVTAANNTAVKLQGADGITKMVARNSKTFGQIQPEAAPAPAEAPRSMMKPGFDPDAWQKERDDRIKASREAGNTHLDKLPAYVETMRGKDVYGVHDTKVRGRILTVDNNGNVYVEWLDAYSQEKEMAVPMKYGKKTVMQTSLGPRDLKDYVVGKPTQEPNEAARPQAQAAAGESAAPAAAPAPAAPAVVPGAGPAAVEADGVKPAPSSTPELQAYMAASAEVTRLETALIDLRSDTRIKPKGRDEWLRKIGALERELAAAKAERTRAGSAMRATPNAEAPASTQAPAPVAGAPVASAPPPAPERTPKAQAVKEALAPDLTTRKGMVKALKKLGYDATDLDAARTRIPNWGRVGVKLNTIPFKLDMVVELKNERWQFNALESESPQSISQQEEIAKFKADFAKLTEPPKRAAQTFAPPPANVSNTTADLDTSAGRVQRAAASEPVATHKDPGEPAEPVTPAVVREAIKTGVQDTGRKPSAMRAELLREIDRAIEEAPDYGDYQAMVKSMGQKDGAAVMMERGEIGAPPGYSRPKRTFKVEGDGVFTIQNSVRQLLKFRAQVEKSPGFKDRQAPAGLNERATDALDRRSTDAAIANMVEEGDFQAALDYAEAKEVDIGAVKLTKLLRDRLEKWQKDQASAKAVADYEAARAEGKPAPGSLAAVFAENEAEAAPAPAAEPEADDIPEAGIASQTFDQWVRAKYAGNKYKARYLEEFEGNETRAILGAAIGTTDNDRKTPDLLKEARAKYHRELLDLPRETTISLEVWDALGPLQYEAQRHFYDLDSRITRRTQDQTSARVKAEREKKAPYEAAYAEVDAEIRRLDAIPGPETQKQKDLSARRDRLREALYQIGQGKEPDGRLLRKEASEPTPAAQAPAERDEQKIELRKRLSVLRSLRECIG